MDRDIIHQKEKLEQLEKELKKYSQLIFIPISFYVITICILFSFNIVDISYILILSVLIAIMHKIILIRLFKGKSFKYLLYQYRYEKDILNDIIEEKNNTFIGTLILINGDKIEGQFTEYRNSYIEKNSNTGYFKDKIISVIKK